MIKEKIIEIIANICRNNKPYVWINENYVPYDRSGKVVPMLKRDLDDVLKNLDSSSPIYDSKLEALLNNVYINESQASYVSGCGIFYTSYAEIIREQFENWLYNAYKVFDEDGEYLDGMIEFEEESLESLDEVLKTTNIDIYVQMIKNKISA